jgi:hypothetical protein
MCGDTQCPSCGTAQGTYEPEYRGFYFVHKKYHYDMTRQELRDEMDAYERYANRCREIGQGISTKEYVRFQRCFDCYYP